MSSPLPYPTTHNYTLPPRYSPIVGGPALAKRRATLPAGAKQDHPWVYMELEP